MPNYWAVPVAAAFWLDEGYFVFAVKAVFAAMPQSRNGPRAKEKREDDDKNDPDHPARA